MFFGLRYWNGGGNCAFLKYDRSLLLDTKVERSLDAPQSSRFLVRAFYMFTELQEVLSSGRAFGLGERLVLKGKDRIYLEPRL